MRRKRRTSHFKATKDSSFHPEVSPLPDQSEASSLNHQNPVRLEFSWTPDQSTLRDEAIRFAQDVLTPALASADDDFPREAWSKLGEFGALGFNVPTEYGGRGLDIQTTVHLMDGIGYGCPDNGLLFALSTQIWTQLPAILAFGTDDQKSRLLPDLCAGKRVCAFAITESETGSDSFALSTTARPTEGGYLLNGTKSYVTFGPVADVAIVFANVNPELGRWGVTAFIVRADSEGYQSGPTQEKMGLQSAPMSDIILTECFVSEENRLGPEGGGVSLFNNSMKSERGYILATHLGAMERQLEKAIEYGRSRTAFGKPIGKFQSIGNRVAEMKVRLDAARLLVQRVAWLESTGQPLAMEAAIANLFLGEAFVDSSLDAIRIHGAHGYMSDNAIESDLRDGIGGLIYGGTSDIQRDLIAKLLGL